MWMGKIMVLIDMFEMVSSECFL